MLHAGLASEDPTYGKAFCALLAEVASELADRFVLCLVLLVERIKGDASKWKPYITMLPTAYGVYRPVTPGTVLRYLCCQLTSNLNRRVLRCGDTCMFVPSQLLCTTLSTLSPLILKSIRNDSNDSNEMTV